MKHIFTLSLLFILALQTGFAGDMRANLSLCSFWSPQDGPFIETYISVNAATINLVRDGDGFTGAVEITMIFSQGDQVSSFKKYELVSPLIRDTVDIGINFIDQQRFILEDGEYMFEISIRDKHSTDSAVSYTQPVRISFPGDEVTMSGIELVESYKEAETPGILTKSGIDLVPYVYNYFPPDMDRLKYYTEIYGTSAVMGEGQGFLVNSYVQGYETGEKIKQLQRAKRKKAAEVVVVMQEFDISQLPSGNYNLVTEVRNQQNELVTSNQLFFQRINPDVQLRLEDIAALDVSESFVDQVTNKDTLSEYIRCLNPISSELERVFAEKHLANANLALMQQFFLNFWLERDQLRPQDAWADYYDRVKHVDQHFSTLIKNGYETDRGIVYLKYGPPNTITESHHEPSAYPYEIWHYYQLRNQRNKKFVFYSRDMVTNDFELIHSDAMGEISNYRWQVDVMKRTTDGYDLDKQNTQDHWGGKIDTYYNNPR